MQYISPFSFFPDLVDKSIERKDIILAKRRWLAEFDLLGTSTITINNKEFNKDELLKLFDNLEKTQNIDFHLLIAKDKELLHFLEHNTVEQQYKFQYKKEDLGQDFLAWVSPYFSHSFKKASVDIFKAKNLYLFKALNSLPLYITDDYQYEIWEPLQNYFQRFIEQVQELNEQPDSSVNDDKIAQFTNYELSSLIKELPVEHFQHQINDYAYEVMRCSISAFNTLKLYEWSLVILDNALMLPVNDETREMLQDKKKEMQHIINRMPENRSYDYSSSRSSSSDNVWPILRIVLFVVYVLFRVATCNNSSSPSYKTTYDNSAFQEVYAKTFLRQMGMQYTMSQDSLLFTFLTDLRNDGTKINFKQTITTLKNGDDPYESVWKSSLFKKAIEKNRKRNKLISSTHGISEEKNSQSNQDIVKDEPVSAVEETADEIKLDHPLQIKNDSKLNLIVFVATEEAVFSKYVAANSNYTLNLLTGKNVVYLYAGSDFAFSEDFDFIADTTKPNKKILVKGKFVTGFPTSLHLVEKPIYYKCSNNIANQETPSPAKISCSSNEDGLKIKFYDALNTKHLTILDEMYNTSN